MHDDSCFMKHARFFFHKIQFGSEDEFIRAGSVEENNKVRDELKLNLFECLL